MRYFFRPLKLNKKKKNSFFLKKTKTLFLSKKTKTLFFKYSRTNFGSFFVILWMDNCTPPNTTIVCKNLNFHLLYIISKFWPFDPWSTLKNLKEKHGILNLSLSQNHIWLGAFFLNFLIFIYFFWVKKPNFYCKNKV